MKKRIASLSSSVLLHTAVFAIFFIKIHSATHEPQYALEGKNKIMEAHLMTQPLPSPANILHPQDIVFDKHGTVLIPVKKTLSIHKKVTPSPTEPKKLDGDTLNQLVSLVYQTISEHQVAPGNEKTGKAIVSFTLQPDGKILEIKLAGSSGDDAIDQSALKTVQDSSPIEGVSAYLKQSQAMAIPIVYNKSDED